MKKKDQSLNFFFLLFFNYFKQKSLKNKSLKRKIVCFFLFLKIYLQKEFFFIKKKHNNSS